MGDVCFRVNETKRRRQMKEMVRSLLNCIPADKSKGD